MEYLDQLIQLYATCSIENIETNASYQGLLNQFGSRPSFQADRRRIEEVKARIEGYLSGRGQREMVQQAIRLLRGTRSFPERRDLCHRILVAGYKPLWTAAQQAYFDKAWEKIKLKYDYFLSFTTRRPPVAGDNPINSHYRKLISSELAIGRFTPREREEKNLLALTVHRLLTGPGTQVFFFEHKRDDNEVVDAKLKDACDNCLVFVQLVQNIMFESPCDRTNYCFFEWNQVRGDVTAPNDRRILFVVAEASRHVVEGFPVFLDYQTWHGQVLAQDALYLTRNPDKAELQSQKERLKKKIGDTIEGAWLSLTEGVPH